MKIGFDDSFDVTKCLHQIEIPDLLHMCATCAELSSNISTMAKINSNGFTSWVPDIYTVQPSNTVQ